jgi:hypothetical protein
MKSTRRQRARDTQIEIRRVRDGKLLIRFARSDHATAHAVAKALVAHDEIAAANMIFDRRRRRIWVLGHGPSEEKT